MSLSRTGNIKADEAEYLAIIKGKIRQDLRRYLGAGNVTIRQKDGGLISIAMHEIEIPTWRYGFPPDEGVGEGDGEPGKDLGPVDEDEHGKGGQGHGSRKIVIDLTPEEFEEYFMEVLELPRIKPKGDRTIFEEREKYTTLSRKGPLAMRHLRRSWMEALKRAIGEGQFKPPEKTVVTPRNDDFWFKSWDVVREPKNNALIIYKRDVSGSMGARERRVVSYLCNLCEFWLARNYDRLEKVYIIHDDQAEEVDQERFFIEDWGGGTMCSTALAKTIEVIEGRFPVSQWNIYSVYLSDGFNFGNDNETFVNILGERILPIVNQFSYGQIGYTRDWLPSYKQSGANTFSSPGTLGQIILSRFASAENVAFAEISPDNFESAIDAIRKFFQKGN